MHPHIPTTIKYLKIGLASPETMKHWASFAFQKTGEIRLREVTNPKLLDDTGFPILGGLFCQRLFGPVIMKTCLCGPSRNVKATDDQVFIYEEFARNSLSNNSLDTCVCTVCGVEITTPWVRRYRMGAITLAEPMVNILYFTYIRYVLNLTCLELRRMIYSKKETTYRWKVKKKERVVGPQYRGGKHIHVLLEEIQERLVPNYRLLREKLIGTTAKTQRGILCDRIKSLHIFLSSTVKLSWMVLKILPVLPPRLRPFLQVKNVWAFSAINDHYRNIIQRNNRLLQYKSNVDPENTVRPEAAYNYTMCETLQRMYSVQSAQLQECVDKLLHKPGLPTRRYRALRKKREREPLSYAILGKFGVFRQNLLGKRVDFSARAVVLGAPHLSFGACGLPMEIISELFHPFVSATLQSQNKSKEFIGAKVLRKNYYRNRAFRQWVQGFCLSSYIYLNRAPTLHRTNIQAFIPRVGESQGISFFPLACSGFNADFDGDQMGVFLPITSRARKEAKDRIYTYHHSFSPSSGKFVMAPSQDMITGLHLLRSDGVSSLFHSHHYFGSLDDFWTSLDSGLLEIQSIIWVRHRTQGRHRNPSYSSFMVSTPGRLILSLTTLLERVV